MLLGSAVLDFFYVSYVPLIGPAYSALSSSMACRVFRMVNLCITDVCDLDTHDIERALELASVTRVDRYVYSRQGYYLVGY